MFTKLTLELDKFRTLFCAGPVPVLLVRGDTIAHPVLPTGKCFIYDVQTSCAFLPTDCV